MFGILYQLSVVEVLSCVIVADKLDPFTLFLLSQLHVGLLCDSGSLVSYVWRSYVCSNDGSFCVSIFALGLGVLFWIG